MKRTVIAWLVLLSALAMAQNGAKYLIICADNLYSSIMPLAEWKQATGLKVKVVRESQIGYDTTAIKDFVRGAWASWDPRPEFVLLVGSASVLPSRLYYSHGSVYVSSDNIYGDMTGDFQAEIPVGRLPAATAAQLDVMVAKTLEYERHPDLTDSLWMRRMTTIVREGGDQDDTLYWNNVRNAAAKAGAAGFVGVDSLSYYRGHTAADVIASANRGTGIILYRGTANGAWYEPFSVRPSQITATNKLFIVTSITCETMTLIPGEEMMGDSWMRTGTPADLRGAVAFFGNTHSASEVAELRGAVARGFYDGLFAENIYKLGATMLRAKRQLYEEFPSYTSDYRGFSLLGDPDLSIWTATPRLLAVTHPATIEPGQQELPVSVMHDGAPVPGATVCASMTADTTVYAVGSTDATGSVSLSINPHVAGLLRIVVTGQNLCPYDALIQVGQSAVAEPDGPLRPAWFELTSVPAPFRSDVRIAWTAPLREAATLVIADAAGRTLVEVACPTASTGYNWTGWDDRGRPAGPGVYFAVLRDRQAHDRARLKLLKTK